MLTTKSKFYVKEGRGLIYIPAKMLADSQFPLTSTIVAVKIVGKKLVIENDRKQIHRIL